MRLEIAACAMLLACSESPTATCPSGARADATRASAIESRLASVEQGRALLDAAGSRVAAICFGAADAASVVTSEHVVVLANGLEEGEAAARLGHLLVHLRDGLPIDAVRPGLDARACDDAVDRAMSLEARAYVVEIALQDALHAQPRSLVFDFAADVRGAAPEARESIALAYLHAHPDGAPGIDGLESAYRARCVR